MVHLSPTKKKRRKFASLPFSKRQSNSQTSTTPAQPKSVTRALQHAERSHKNRRDEERSNASAVFNLVGATLQAIQKIYALLISVELVLEAMEESQSQEKLHELAELYHKVLDEIDTTAISATVKGTNLINGRQHEHLLANEWHEKANFAVSHIDLTTGRRGLKVPSFGNDPLNADTIAMRLVHARRAQHHLIWAEGVFVSEAAVAGMRFAAVLKEA